MRRVGSSVGAAHGFTPLHVAPSRHLPGVEQCEAVDRRRAPTGEHADLVAVGRRVEVAADEQRAAGGSLAAVDERGDLGDRVLPAAGRAGWPIEGDAVRVELAARAVEDGPQHEPAPAVVDRVESVLGDVE